MAKQTAGIWRYGNAGGKGTEGKFLVVRRDGSTPEWPNFVLGAKDPAAPAALRAYADECEQLGIVTTQYVSDMRRMVEEFEQYRLKYGDGDPGAQPHRKDDAATIDAMKFPGCRVEVRRCTLV